MLSRGSPLFKAFNSHLDFPVWSGRTSLPPQLGLRERNYAKKNNLKSQVVGTRLTESLKKLIESLDLCSQEANGYEQIHRLEWKSPNSDRQNNYPPDIWKCICISHGRLDPFGWFAMAPSHGGEASVWFTVAPLCAEASCQTFQSDDCLIMS